MKAMVLAAGVGSRLRPLTDSLPKALVEVGGAPMLEIVLKRLIAAGVDAAIVNTHHHPGQVEAFLRARRNFGIRIELSHEPELLDTGGGLKKAAWFLEGKDPFFVHNVDIYTDLDLSALCRAHRESGALATLAVQERPSSRYLLFDGRDRLCGWGNEDKGRLAWAGGPVAGARRLAFCGIHVVSPALLPRITETGAFSIFTPYVRLAGGGADIRAFPIGAAYCQDIGSAEKLEAARRRAAGRQR